MRGLVVHGTCLVGFVLVLELVAALAPMGMLTRARSQSGFTTSLRLTRSAHPVPPGAPTLVAHAGPRFDPRRPIEVVLFFHGWNGCVEVLVRSGRASCRPDGATEDGWGIADRVDAAGRNTLLLAPQLAFRSRDGAAGRLANEGYAKAMIDEAMAALGPSVGGKRIADVSRVTIVAHSAGFEAALVVGRRSGLGDTLDRIALMDALYDVESAFLRWVGASEHRSLVSLHTGGRTEQHGTNLGRIATLRFGSGAVAVDPPDLAAAVRTRRVVVSKVRTGHVETLLRYLPDVLARP